MRRRLTALSAALGGAALLCAGLAQSGAGGGRVRPGGRQHQRRRPVLPAAGDSGHEIAHYDLNLRYEPATKALSARANLVGHPASFSRTDGELVITPHRAVFAGQV